MAKIEWCRWTWSWAGLSLAIACTAGPVLAGETVPDGARSPSVGSALGADVLSQDVGEGETPTATVVVSIQVRIGPDAVQLVLGTASGGELVVSSTEIEGQTLVFTIPNARLELPGGGEFQQDNLTENILGVRVRSLDETQIEVRIVGRNAAPLSRWRSTPMGLVIGARAREAEAIELVVTAEKRPENLQDVSISVTPITQEEIEAADITSLAEIAGNVPNFTTFTPNRNFVFYSVRGLSNFNFLSRDPVAFYIDDVPFDYNGFLDLDLPDIERVEVLRGPQATLYGRNAEAGVVNIITRKPSDEFTFNSSVSYANFDNPEIRLGVGGPLVADKLFFRLSSSFDERDGFVENSLGPDLGDEEGFTSRAQLLWTPSGNWEVSFNASLDRYRDGTPPFTSTADDPFEIDLGFEGFNDLDTDTQSFKVAYNSPRLRFTSITARRFSDQESEGGFDFGGVSVQDLDIDSTVFSQELRLQSGEDADRFTWLVGAYYEDRSFNVAEANFLATAIDLTRISSEIDEQTFALFAQASYQVAEPLTLIAGVRFETSDSELDSVTQEGLVEGREIVSESPLATADNDGDELIPRFAIEYRLKPDVMLYGSVARGYKPPGVNFRSRGSADLLTFDEQKSWNYELGLKSSFLGDLSSANLSVFHNTIDDYQVPIRDNAGFFIGVDNADVDITGFEIELRARLSERFSAIAGFGLADAEFTRYVDPNTGRDFEGEALPYAPELNYNLALQYRERNGIFARLELQGVGETVLDEFNNIEQEPFALFNARLGYEFEENYGIYLFANNIFDTEYLVSAFGTTISSGAPATYGVQFRTRF